MGLLLPASLHHPRSNVLRGSKASRTASPVKTKSDSMVAITMKPVSPSQGACRFDLPCNNSSPSDGDPGGRPKPRKSSEVKVVIDEFRMKGRNVRVATMAFGRTCFQMILAFDRPSARAALTYSKLRARRNSARTTWTSETQEKSNRMTSRTRKLGVMIEETMIRR